MNARSAAPLSTVAVDYSGRICVSVYGRTIGELRNNFRLARGLETGYVELRLDYLPQIPSKLSDVAKFESFEGQIFTFRARSEGGMSRLSTKHRANFLTSLISELVPPIIDLEFSTLEEIPELYDKLRSPNRTSRLLISSHNFQRTEDMTSMENLIVYAVEKYSPDFVKIVRFANEFQDNLTMLSLYRLAQRISPAKLIAFCVGPLGIFSRIACISCGSPFTYASLPGKETAPGQMDAKLVKTLLESW
jgi:3-dehydroquinate dehydratase I